MTTLTIDGTDLVVNVEGPDRFWAFKSELRIPLAHVTGSERATEEARKWFHGLRLGGTNLPGVITAGNFIEREGWVFWDVHDPQGAIAIHLRDDHYARLVIEVADPGAAIAMVRAAIAKA
jgi:hypothetical protein